MFAYLSQWLQFAFVQANLAFHQLLYILLKIPLHLQFLLNMLLLFCFFDSVMMIFLYLVWLYFVLSYQLKQDKSISLLSYHIQLSPLSLALPVLQLNLHEDKFYNLCNGSTYIFSFYHLFLYIALFCHILGISSSA